MRRTPRLLPLLGAVVGAAFVVLVSWAAVSGPVGLPRSSGTAVAPSPTPDRPTATASPAARPRTVGHGAHHPPAPHLFLGTWLLSGVAVLLVLAALSRVGRVGVRAWHHRRVRRRDAALADAPLVPTGEAVARALREDLDQQLAALGRGTPRNGIVAAWSRLEEVAAASGVAREPWETPGEFTTRLLRTLDVDPLAAGTLAALYRRARFSRHEVTERDRDAAAAAWERLREEVPVR